MTSLKGLDPYAIAEHRLAALAARSSPAAPAPVAICAILQEAIPTYNWVGLLVGAGAVPTLVASLGPARIRPRERALQDLAEEEWAPGMTPVVVHDVQPGSRVGTCFPGARALIAVPVGHGPQWRGTLVVASEHRGAFGPADRAFLAEFATALARQGASG